MKDFRVEMSHQMEAMQGGAEELSAMRTLMDDDDRCQFCECAAAFHAPHIERVRGEPILISLACMGCAIERNIPMSTCYLSPQNVVDATPAARLQAKKTLSTEDERSLIGVTRSLAAMAGCHYDPVTS